MNFIRKTIKLHGAREVFVLTPKCISKYITATQFKGNYCVFSNGTGYAALRDIFSAACALQQNEIMHVPLNFGYNVEYQSSHAYADYAESHFKNLVFMNYATSRFDAKDILTAIKTQTYKQDSIIREYAFSKEWVKQWKTDKRLTVKPSGGYLIFSANRDVFTMMAQSCENLSEYGDYTKYNEQVPHIHHNWDENTSSSVGITFYYWTPPQKRKRMSDQVFLHQLRRGLGSAIIELKNNPNNEKYKDMLLRCCLKDIGYDTEPEATKGYYLHTAIRALDCNNEFYYPIENAFLKHLYYPLFKQLHSIIQSFVEAGWYGFTEMLDAKYAQLREMLSKQQVLSLRYSEQAQFEYMMVDRIQDQNWKAFRNVVEDAGEIILSRKDGLCSCYDWFISNAEEQFGKERVWNYLNKESLISDNAKAFTDGYLQIKQIRDEDQAKQKDEKVSISAVVNNIYPLFAEKHTYKHIAGYYQFAHEATTEELMELSQYIDNESADIQHLIGYATSDNKQLKQAAIGALKRFKDLRIHDAAVGFLELGDVESGLALLKNNWKAKDDALIRKAVLKSKRVTHFTQMALGDIYGHNQSSSCREVLMHAYRNGRCAYCRLEIVEAMGNNKVLQDEILEECLYDSYDETRAYANKMIKNKGVEA